MAKLTGTQHSDAANALFAFYAEKAHELEEAGQFFIAAIALAFAIETAILTYLLVEFSEDNGGELRIIGLQVVKPFPARGQGGRRPAAALASAAGLRLAILEHSAL